MRVSWGWAPTPRDEQAPGPEHADDRTAVHHTARPTDHPTPREGTTDHV
jgi:hypothetical protein